MRRVSNVAGYMEAKNKAEDNMRKAIEQAWDEEDARSSKAFGWRYRLMIKLFGPQSLIFFKSIVALAADRKIVSTEQANALSRSAEKRIGGEIKR